jgi:hypothetical protein
MVDVNRENKDEIVKKISVDESCGKSDFLGNSVVLFSFPVEDVSAGVSVNEDGSDVSSDTSADVHGDFVGTGEGDSVGGGEGDSVGGGEGDLVGGGEGDSVGGGEDDSVGGGEGDSVGGGEDDSVGGGEGDSVRNGEGDVVGANEGDFVGDGEGNFVGDGEDDSNDLVCHVDSESVSPGSIFSVADGSGVSGEDDSNESRSGVPSNSDVVGEGVSGDSVCDGDDDSGITDGYVSPNEFPVVDSLCPVVTIPSPLLP